jgi:ketosteroid isomerase-like protein
MGWDDEHPVGESGATGTDVVARTTRAIRATLEGDSAEVGALFAPDVHAVLPGSVWSAAALAVEIEDRHGAFEDVDLRISHALEHGDEIWIEWFASVVHAKSLALDDIVIEPSGNRTELRGVTIAHCREGRIMEFRQYCDMSPLLGGDPMDRRPPSS